MITREQIADLRPGDVVEVTNVQWPNGTTVRGPLYEAYGWLYVAERPIRNDQGQPVFSASSTLTVISRAKPPLYVNHDRSEPVPGDVVRDADDNLRRTVWLSSGLSTDGDQCWIDVNADWCERRHLPARLRLLVDGQSGQVVP